MPYQNNNAASGGYSITADNELSERIKREAFEFMNLESSYEDKKGKMMGGNLEGGGGRHDERVDDTTVMVSGEESS